MYSVQGGLRPILMSIDDAPYMKGDELLTFFVFLLALLKVVIAVFYL